MTDSTETKPEAPATWNEIPKNPLLHLKPTQIIGGIEDRARDVYPDQRELVESIIDKGVIQPLAVQATDDPNRYLLLAGGRRYSAALLARLSPLPCVVFPKDLSDIDAKEIQLFENVHRKNFTWHEEDKLVKEIHTLKVSQHGIALGGGSEKTGHSIADTGVLLGKERSTVSKSITRADAVEKHPEVAHAKTASEADKLLKRIERRNIAKVAAEAYEEEVINVSDEESRKRKLANGYMKGDFFEEVKFVPKNSARLIEIDPPYGIELEDIKRAEGDTLSGYTETKEYEEFITEVMQECSRVLNPNGWIICWHAFQWAEVTKKAMESIDIRVNPIPGFWVKSQGQTNQPEKRLASAVEPFFYGTKDGHIIKQGRNNYFHYRGVNPSNKIHPTERPIEMITELISTFVNPNAFLFVPFLGSGNSLLAGSNAGMGNTFGYDLDVEDVYRNGFVKKVQDGNYGQFKSYV